MLTRRTDAVHIRKPEHNHGAQVLQCTRAREVYVCGVFRYDSVDFT